MYLTKFKNKCEQLGLIGTDLRHGRKVNIPQYINKSNTVRVLVNGRPDHKNLIKDSSGLACAPFVHDENCDIYIELNFTEDPNTYDVKRITLKSCEFFSMSCEDMSNIIDYATRVKSLIDEKNKIKKQLRVITNSHTVKRVLIKKLHTFEDMFTE